MHATQARLILTRTGGRPPIEPKGVPMETQRTEQTGDRWIVRILNDIIRSGSWSPPSRLSSFALVGDVDLDLREATLPPNGVAISAVAPFGNIDVVVAEGAAVVVRGFSVLGSKRITVKDPAADRPEGAI